MNKPRKHPAVWEKTPTRVGQALRRAAKKVGEALGAGAPRQHPAIRANEKGSANIAANRTPRNAAPKQHPAIWERPSGRSKSNEAPKQPPVRRERPSGRSKN